MSRTLEVFEHGKLHVAASGDGIRPHELDALVRFNDRHGGQYFEVGHKHLKARNFVGYVEVGALSIEILPKADRSASSPAPFWRSGLLEMLRVALGLRLEPLSSAAQRLTRSPLLDLIAQAYLTEIEPLLREGLAKGYRTDQANGTVFRGRLKIAEHLRDNIARADRFFVEYQTFDHDIAVNRLLAAALHVLSWCALSPGVAARVDSCLARFPEVQIAAGKSNLLDQVRLTRATQRYGSALVYAQMILAQQGPALHTGRERVFALLFDMNLLWERFVAVLLRRASPPGLQINTQERHEFWAPLERAVHRVRPDIVVRTDTPGGSGKTLLVIDTKWKVPAEGIPSDDDLKQMFVYNELLEGARSMLLYPMTESSVAVSGLYAKKAHGCEMFHLGLVGDSKWSTPLIRTKLATLLGELSTSTPSD